MNRVQSWWMKLLNAAFRVPAVKFNDLVWSFTPRALAALNRAHKLAASLNRSEIDPEHLLLGLIDLRQGVAFNVLRRLRIDCDALRQEAERCAVRGEIPPSLPPSPSLRLQNVLLLARRESAGLCHAYVGTEHIFLALLQDRDGNAFRVLERLNLTPDLLRREILQELNPNFGFSDAGDGQDTSKE